MIRAEIGGPVIIEFGGVVIRSESGARVEFEGGKTDKMDVVEFSRLLNAAQGRHAKPAKESQAPDPVSVTPVCPDEERFNDRNAMYIGNRLTAILDAMPEARQRLIDQGIHRSDISVYRRNSGRATREKVVRLAKALGMTAGEFLAGNMPQPGFARRVQPGGHTNMTKPNAPAPEKPKEPEKKSGWSRKPGIDIGSILGAWLAMSGMTQTEVSKRGGILAPDVNKHMRAGKPAGETAIEKYAKAFGVTVEEFLAGPKERKPLAAPSGGVSTHAGELVDRWMTARGLSHEDVANAAQMDRTLLTGILLGKVMIGETLKATFARVFRVSIEEFLAGPPEDMLPDPPVGTSIEDVGRYALRTGTNR